MFSKCTTNRLVCILLTLLSISSCAAYLRSQGVSIKTIFSIPIYLDVKQGKDYSLIKRKLESDPEKLIVLVNLWNKKKKSGMDTWIDWGELIPIYLRPPEEEKWMREHDLLTFDCTSDMSNVVHIEHAAGRLEAVMGIMTTHYGYKKIHFITHRIGGLVVQQFIVGNILDGDKIHFNDKISTIQFVDVPDDRPTNTRNTDNLGDEEFTNQIFAEVEWREKFNEKWIQMIRRNKEKYRDIFIKRTVIYLTQPNKNTDYTEMIDRFTDPFIGAKARIVEIPGDRASSGHCPYLS